MAPKTNKKWHLVPVQRQITRNGKTFMTTVYVQPRHAPSSKDKTIQVPDWHFKSLKDFDDEFQRLNKLRDKTERHYLKEQLLEHVENHLGITYDKVPSDEPKAFVRNSLRGFSQAKKHLAEGKGYVKDPPHIVKEKEAQNKRAKKKTPPAQKKQRKVKLPSKIAEAYDRATPTAKVLATVTGIVAEDAQTEKWLAERVRGGEFDLGTGPKDALDGNKTFENMIGNINQYKRDSMQIMGSADFEETTLASYSRSLDRYGSLGASEFTHYIGVGESIAGDEYKAIHKRVHLAAKDHRDLMYGIRNLDGNLVESSRGMWQDGDYLTRSETTSLDAAEATLDKVGEMHGYLEKLMNEKNGSLADVTYQDVAQRMANRAETLQNGSTDDVWKTFDLDTMLDAEYVAGGGKPGFVDVNPYWTRKARMQEHMTRTGGDTDAWLDAHLMSQTLQYHEDKNDANFYDRVDVTPNSAAVGVIEQFDYAVTRNISDDLNDRLLKYTKDGLGIDQFLPDYKLAPSMKLLKSALRAEIITQDELVEIVKPGLAAISAQTTIVGSRSAQDYIDGKAGAKTNTASIADGSAEYAQNSVFNDMIKQPAISPVEEGKYRNRSAFGFERYRTSLGVDIDPFRSLRVDAGEVREDKENVGTFARSTGRELEFDPTKSRQEVASQLKEREEKRQKLMDIRDYLATDKLLKRDLMKMNAARHLTSQNRVSGRSNWNVRRKFLDGIHQNKLEFPDDEILDDPKVPYAVKQRYLMKYVNTLEKDRPKLDVELRNALAARTDLSSYKVEKLDAKGNPVKETKAQRFNRLKGSAAQQLNSLVEERKPITEEVLNGIEAPEARDLLKASVKTTVGAVSGPELKKISDDVVKNHDRVEHTSFRPKVHGVYEVKETLQDDKYEEMFKSKGGSSGTFYHGTSFTTTQKILGDSGGFKVFQGGKDVKSGSMLGYGIYLADMSSKSAQYISNSGFSRSLDRGSLMIVEAALGKEKAFEGRRDVRRNHTNEPYDSITAMKGKDVPGLYRPLRNNEWLVKDALQARPRYIIDYERERP